MKTTEVTGPELKAYSEKMVSDKMLKAACEEKYFKEFIRIFIAMNIGTAYTKTPSSFGHCLTLVDGMKNPVRLDIDVSIKVAGK